MMLPRWVFVGIVAGSVGCAPSERAMQPASLPAQAPQSAQERIAATAPAEREPVSEPEADAALRRMSTYLGGLKSFRVDTTITDELVTKEGQKIQFVKQTKVAVRRPDKLWAERTGP